MDYQIAIAHIFHSVFNHNFISYIWLYCWLWWCWHHLQGSITCMLWPGAPLQWVRPWTLSIQGLFTFHKNGFSWSHLWHFVKMTIEVPPDKLHNTIELIWYWLTTPQSTRSVPHQQALVHLRLYQPWKNFYEAPSQWTLPTSHLTKRACLVPSPDMLSDKQRWNKFLSVYNGVSLLHSSPWPVSHHHFCTDTCTAGIGGFFSGMHWSSLPFNRFTWIVGRYHQHQVVVWGSAGLTHFGSNWQL